MSAEKRWRVTLVSRTQFFRLPRSKKKRILKKWLKRPENYRPLMVPIGTSFAFGSMAFTQPCPKRTEQPDPYWNHEDPSRPRWIEMHPDLWAQVQITNPEFAALCDIYDPKQPQDAKTEASGCR